MISKHFLEKANKVRMLLAGKKLGTELKYDEEGRLTLEVAKKVTAETFKDKVLTFEFIIPKGFFNSEPGEQCKTVLEDLKLNIKTRKK